MIAMVVEIEGVTTPHPLLTPIIEGGQWGPRVLGFLVKELVNMHCTLYNVLVHSREETKS